MTQKDTTSPYALRMEMLQMAKDYLDKQYDIIHEAAYQTWQAQVELAKSLNNKIPDFPTLTIYDPSKIMEIAEKFNMFVSKK